VPPFFSPSPQDVEGAEALVLAGSQRLFQAHRVSYVIFENHV
jgi:hypothetical protein